MSNNNSSNTFGGGGGFMQSFSSFGGKPNQSQGFSAGQTGGFGQNQGFGQNKPNQQFGGSSQGGFMANSNQGAFGSNFGGSQNQSKKKGNNSKSTPNAFGGGGGNAGSSGFGGQASQSSGGGWAQGSSFGGNSQTQFAPKGFGGSGQNNQWLKSKQSQPAPSPFPNTATQPAASGGWAQNKINSFPPAQAHPPATGQQPKPFGGAGNSKKKQQSVKQPAGASGFGSGGGGGFMQQSQPSQTPSGGAPIGGGFMQQASKTSGQSSSPFGQKQQQANAFGSQPTAFGSQQANPFGQGAPKNQSKSPKDFSKGKKPFPSQGGGGGGFMSQGQPQTSQAPPQKPQSSKKEHSSKQSKFGQTPSTVGAAPQKQTSKQDSKKSATPKAEQEQEQQPYDAEAGDYYDEEGEYYDEEYGEEGHPDEEQMQEMMEQMKRKLKVCKYQSTCTKSDCEFVHLEGMPKISEEHCLHYITFKCQHGDDNCKKKHDEATRSNYLKILSQKKEEYVKDMMNKAMKQQASPPKKIEKKEENPSKTKAEASGSADAPNTISSSQMNQIFDKNKGKSLNLILKKADQPKAAPSQPEEDIFAAYAKSKTQAPAQPSKPSLIVSSSVQVSQSGPKHIVHDPQFIMQRIAHFVQKLSQLTEADCLPNKAHCLQMCSEQEKQNDMRNNNAFEQDAGGNLGQLLMVKRFIKSEPGKNMSDPAIIRPTKVLGLTMRYMRDCVVDLDFIKPGQTPYTYTGDSRKTTSGHQFHEFKDIYSFVKDRTRQIGQDLTILSLQEADKDAIRAQEQAVRFLIISQVDFFSDSNLMIPNTKQMTGILSDLSKHDYKLAQQVQDPALRGKLLKNQYEMLCYQLITIASQSKESLPVLQQAIELKPKLPPHQQVLLSQALKITQAIRTQNYSSFLKLFPKVHFMFACLMLGQISMARDGLFEQLRRAMTQAPPPLDFIADALFFSSAQDCAQYITMRGYHVQGSRVDFQNPGSNQVSKFRQTECKQIDALWARGPGRLRKDFIKQGLEIQDGEQLKKMLEQEKERKKKLAELEAKKKAEAEMLRQRQLIEERKRKEEEARKKKEQLLREAERRAQHNWKNLRSTKKAYMLYQLREAAEEYNTYVYEMELARQKRIEKKKRKMLQQINEIQGNAIVSSITEKNLEVNISRSKNLLMKMWLRRWRFNAQSITQSMQKQIKQKNAAFMHEAADALMKTVEESHGPESAGAKPWDFEIKQKTLLDLIEAQLPKADDPIVVKVLADSNEIISHGRMAAQNREVAACLPQVLYEFISQTSGSTQSKVRFDYTPASIGQQLIEAFSSGGFSALLLPLLSSRAIDSFEQEAADQMGLVSVDKLPNITQYLESQEKKSFSKGTLKHLAQTHLIVLALNFDSSDIRKFEKAFPGGRFGDTMISRCSVINLDLHMLLSGETKSYPRFIELKLKDKKVIKQFANALGDSGIVRLPSKDPSAISNLAMLFRKSLKALPVPSGKTTLEQFNEDIGNLQESLASLRGAIISEAKLQFHTIGAAQENKKHAQNLTKALDVITFLGANLQKLPSTVDGTSLEARHLVALFQEAFLSKILGSGAVGGQDKSTLYDLIREKGEEDPQLKQQRLAMIEALQAQALRLLSPAEPSRDLFAAVVEQPISQLVDYYCSDMKPFFWSDQAESNFREPMARKSAVDFSSILKQQFPEDFSKKKKSFSALGKRIPTAPLSSRVLEATKAHKKAKDAAPKKRDLKEQRKAAAEAKLAVEAAAAKAKRQRHLQAPVLGASYFRPSKQEELASKEMQDEMTRSDTQSEEDPLKLARRVLKKLEKKGYYHEVVISDDEGSSLMCGDY